MTSLELLTGSMGTLGIIAELTLKVRPRPEAAAVVRVGFPTLAGALSAAGRLGSSATRPVSLDVLDRMASRSVMPGRDAEAWCILVGFEGNAPAVAWQVERIRAELDAGDAAVLEGLDAEITWAALTDWQAAEVGPLTIKANLRPTRLEGWLARLDPDRWAVAVHAGSGIARAHRVGEADLEAIAPEVDQLRVEAVRLGGNLTLPRCPTAWKERLPVWGEPESDLAVARRVKHALDPGSVLNPGRFVGDI